MTRIRITVIDSCTIWAIDEAKEIKSNLEDFGWVERIKPIIISDETRVILNMERDEAETTQVSKGERHKKLREMRVKWEVSRDKQTKRI